MVSGANKNLKTRVATSMDGTFDLKIHAVVVWGGGNLYNLDEMERWYFIKPWKNFFPTYSVLEKSAYHLIVAISVELPIT